MKQIIYIIFLLSFYSCSEYKNNIADFKATTPKEAKAKKLSAYKKEKTSKDISGTFSNGTLFEATPDSDGFIVSFDPFIPKKDDVFLKASNQLVSKLYNDQINDESHISIESNIDYMIFKGKKSRYRIAPLQEIHGEISAISITAIL